jgi:hypothetical protein
MKAFIRLLISGTLLLALLGGCATPGHRAKQNPAAFHRLSPSDQKLVLKGKIRPGLDRDAVYIAWGPPDWKLQGGKGQEECESWIYYRDLTTYLPISSYDMISPSGVALEPRFSLGLNTGINDGGLGRDGFLYAPRVLITDVRFKRADFRHGLLHNYSILRNGHYLTPHP